jgi:hypothetical protein
MYVPRYIAQKIICEALSPIRMKILGEPILAQKFRWSPNTLLEMITEIDKLCPEEGHPNQQNNPMDPAHQTQPSNVTE